MQTIYTLAELDVKLAECAAAKAVSDSALREVFASFCMDTSVDVPSDPFSVEYLDHQMALYRHLAGKAYAPENEVTEFDAEEGARIPFPFRTGITALAGDHTMAVGFLLKHIAVSPGSRVIEFGAGWGNTSIALAQLGYDVTVVDIEKRFCDVIASRARQLNLDIKVIHADFFSAESITEPYDAALFYECFHHCSDHMRLLRALRTAVKPGGRVYFGCEPILDTFPIHWGIRADGESLWATRTNGWLELGFKTEYFVEALKRAGWAASRHSSRDLDWVTVWEARRIDSALTHSFKASDSRIQTAIGERRAGEIIVDGAEAGYGMFGPYITLDPGEWVVRLNFADTAMHGVAVFDVCSGHGVAGLGSLSVDLAHVQGRFIDLPLTVTEVTEAVEARLFCEQGLVASISGLQFVREASR